MIKEQYVHYEQTVLTLKTPITTAADYKFCDSFFMIFEEIRHDIS